MRRGTEVEAGCFTIVYLRWGVGQRVCSIGKHDAELREVDASLRTSENEEYSSEMNIDVVLLPSWRSMCSNRNTLRLVAE